MQIKSHFSNKWKEHKNAAFTGVFFNNCGQMLKESLIDDCFSIHAEVALKENLKQLNGYWAYVSFAHDICLLAVDRIRSYPLFYSIYNDVLYISCDANWILSQIGKSDIDEASKVEFLMTGFIPGNSTLSPFIKQVQAGSYVYIKITKDNEIKVDEVFYCNYSHTTYYDADEIELLNLWERVLTNIFTRLIQVAKGRQLVIPLSGGYDSRYIAFMLKRMGYDNILAYSYGKVGGEEARISQFVAHKLGIPWYFIEYTPDRWKSIYSSDVIKNFYKYASNLNSLPHMQDYPAILWLKENILSHNAIFLPGISADLNTGGFWSKYTRIYSASATLEDLKNLILEYSYSITPWNICDSDVRDSLSKRLDIILQSQYTQMSAGEGFERWVAVEKVAKFVLNSVRAYEFAGFEWWTPYWDIDFVDFWYNVPLNLRKGQSLYLSYLKLLTREFQCFNNIDPLFRDGLLSKVSAKEIGIQYKLMVQQKRMLSHLFSKCLHCAHSSEIFVKLLKNIKKIVKESGISAISGAYFDTLLLTLYSEDEINALARQGYRVNGIVAKHYFDFIKF